MKIKHTLVIAAAVLFGLAAVVEAQQAVGAYARYRRLSSPPPTPPAGTVDTYVRDSDGKLCTLDESATVACGGGGSGTVTSVAATVPSFMSVSGSPVTTSGTLAMSLATESANAFFCGPSSGSAATPTFRAMVAADLPATAVTPGTYGDASHVSALTIDQQGRTTAAASTAIALPASAITSVVLPVAQGGTASGTALSGSSIMESNGTAIVQGPAGTTTTVLHGNAAGAPTYSAVALASDVTGALPSANLANTAVTAGSCTYCSLTVNAQGQLTAQSSGTNPSGVYLPLAGGTMSGDIAMAANKLSSTTSVTETSSAASGSGSIAAIVNTTTTWAAGHLFSVQNNGVEKAYVDSAGNVVLTVATAGLVNASNNGILINDSGFAAAIFTGSFGPHTDLSSANGSITHRWTETHSRHFVGGGAAPTFTAGAGIGTSPTVTITGTDAAQLISITSGSAVPGGAATLLTVTYNTAYGVKPKSIQIAAVNAISKTIENVVYVDNDDAGTTTTGFLIKSTASSVNSTQGPYEFQTVVIQ